MKMKKIVFNIIISLIIVFGLTIPNCSRAEGLSWKDIEQDAKNFLEQGESQNPLEEEKLQNIVIPIAQMLVTIGDIVIVIALAVMAIKYMISNPENKAKLKTQLIGVVVSAIVIFGAQFIWTTVYEFLNAVV